MEFSQRGRGDSLSIRTGSNAEVGAEAAAISI